MERPTSLAVVAVFATALVVAPVAATAGAGPPAYAGGEPAATGLRPATSAAVGPADAGWGDDGGDARWGDGRVGVGVTPPSPSDNTTARLVIARYRITQAEFHTVEVGLSGTLQIGADEARYEHLRVGIRRDFEDASSVEERRNAIDRALIELSERARDLEERERAVILAYSDGNVTTSTMVRRLARIDAHARQIDAALAQVRRLTDRIGTDDFDSRIRDVGGTVAALRGPVRERVAMALSAEATPVRVHVVASDRALLLSMLDEGQYVREATKWSNRNRSGPTNLDFGEVGRRFEVLYPWATAQQGGTSITWQGAGAWQLRATHPQGVLEASVDATTSEVYREVQTLDVNDMPSTMTVVRTDQGVRVTFQRTYPGGPLRILIEDAATDAVINARVTVDGYELGRIGADGLVVTTEPRPPYTVNVTGNGSSLSLVMDEPFNATDS